MEHTQPPRFMHRLFLFTLAVLFAGCASTPPPARVSTPMSPSDDIAEFTILQINDVYEITPVEGGRSGGLARVATLRKRLIAEGAPVLTVIAGDFYSPSALGTARVDGERLAGKQMVAVLNALGMDVAALGNHEFDVSEEAFRARLIESDFAYVSANVRPADGAAPFPNVVPRLVVPLGLAPGDTVRVGFTSTVLPSTVKPYVQYTDPLTTLAEQVRQLDAEADVEIGLTHLSFADDATAAATIPGIDMILGGHEHENVRAYRGSRFVPVLKADANARTAFVHRVSLHRATEEVSVESELVHITDAIPDDPEVAEVVEHWVELAHEGFRAQGFDPARVAVNISEVLDGREGTVRTRAALLGQLIAEGFRSAGGVDAALFNGGSIRIDDVITVGPFTEYDAIRVMPFGGEVITIQLPGALLARVLDQGEANAGTGGYLQRSAIERGASGWVVAGRPLDPAATYTIAVNDFLASGREAGLDYFSVEDNPDIVLVGSHGDVRRALIDELTRRYGAE